MTAAIAEFSTVHLYTGAQQGRMRQRMEEAFTEYGASVELHYVRGPVAPSTQFTGDDLIVCDTRFLPHAVHHVLRRRADHAGARFAWAREASGLAQLIEILCTRGVMP